MDIPLIMIIILGIAAFILILFRGSMGKGKDDKAYSYGAAMTIGSRQIQSDAYEVMEQKESIMAVLADGIGKSYGGKIASQIAEWRACGLW